MKNNRSPAINLKLRLPIIKNDFKKNKLLLKPVRIKHKKDVILYLYNQFNYKNHCVGSYDLLWYK